MCIEFIVRFSAISETVFIIQSQGVFKNRIGSRGSDAQLNHSGLQLHSVCKKFFGSFLAVCNFVDK